MTPRIWRIICTYVLYLFVLILLDAKHGDIVVHSVPVGHKRAKKLSELLVWIFPFRELL